MVRIITPSLFTKIITDHKDHHLITNIMKSSFRRIHATK